MATVTLRQLLEAGVHFGHQTRRWNPKMARYIFGQRNGIYIIDLQKTLQQLLKARAIVRDAVAAGGKVLFVGTKKQAREPIEREAKRCGMHYVTNRWLGGTLTNFETVRRSINRLLALEDMETNGKFEKMAKKEVTRFRRERVKLEKNLSGLKSLGEPPQVMFIIDAKKEAIAVREAERLGITCIAVVDTNADPDTVPLPIPGNDDAIRAVGLFCSVIADAVIEGQTMGPKIRAAARPAAPVKPASENEVEAAPAGEAAPDVEDQDEDDAE